MKFAPLALVLAAVVIFFFNLYVHIWNGAIIYLPLLFLGLYGNSPVKTVCGLLWVLLLINLICPYSIVLELLLKTNYIDEAKYQELNNSCSQIRVMLIKSINTAKR